MRTALITGIAGQDGSYLTELLLDKQYQVHGIVRPGALEAPEYRLRHLLPMLSRITLHQASVENYQTIHDVVGSIVPDECYHLAAQSFVGSSFDDSSQTFDTNIKGTHHMLSAVRRLAPHCRFYFAGSSEMFGSAEVSPQSETTRFRPRSIYGISKVAGHDLTRNYRETYGLYAATGLLFNHESPRRGHEYVSRKITTGAARAAAGKLDKLHLGNLDATRDWGHARESVWAMWRMLQQDRPEDYVIATGKSHTVGEFAALAFASAGLDWREFVETDPQFYRPAERIALTGDSTKAERAFGWNPRVSFEELVEEMVAADRAEPESVKRP